MGKIGVMLLFGAAMIALAACEEESTKENPAWITAISSEPEGQVCISGDCLGFVWQGVNLLWQVYFYEPFRHGWSARWVNSSDGIIFIRPHLPPAANCGAAVHRKVLWRMALGERLLRNSR
jgi:hypothetical protein